MYVLPIPTEADKTAEALRFSRGKRKETWFVVKREGRTSEGEDRGFMTVELSAFPDLEMGARFTPFAWLPEQTAVVIAVYKGGRQVA